MWKWRISKDLRAEALRWGLYLTSNTWVSEALFSYPCWEERAGDSSYERGERERTTEYRRVEEE
jgi:hypothetical protein